MHLSKETEQLLKEAPDGEAIRHQLEEVAKLLAFKNIGYKGSALRPLRVFSKADTRQQLLVRIDDKLSRVQHVRDDEDTVLDLIGYLILLRVHDAG